MSRNLLLTSWKHDINQPKFRLAVFWPYRKTRADRQKKSTKSFISVHQLVVRRLMQGATIQAIRCYLGKYILPVTISKINRFLVRMLFVCVCLVFACTNNGHCFETRTGCVCLSKSGSLSLSLSLSHFQLFILIRTISFGQGDPFNL